MNNKNIVADIDHRLDGQSNGFVPTCIGQIRKFVAL